jgi:hypothetical protein
MSNNKTNPFDKWLDKAIRKYPVLTSKALKLYPTPDQQILDVVRSAYDAGLAEGKRQALADAAKETEKLNEPITYPKQKCLEGGECEFGLDAEYEYKHPGSNVVVCLKCGLEPGEGEVYDGKG